MTAYHQGKYNRSGKREARQVTDRYKAFIVTLDHDIRTDDAEPLLDAIRLLRGVLSVEPMVADMDSAIADTRARHELGQKLLSAIYPDRGKR